MRRSQIALAGFWIFAGVMHFVVPRRYEAIMPKYIPYHRECVQASGVAEIVGGLAVFSPRTRNPFARWWILGVLAAVFPANVWMATNTDEVEGAEGIPKPLLWLRLPIQPLLALWAWRATED
ncbi:MAG TPA: hypothetical protein VFY99_10795 [Solirubrobacterales bacterium]